MASVLIIACSRCGGLLIAKAEHKTRTCPYCGLKIALGKAKKIASAENPYEASKILRNLKRDSLQKHKRAPRLL